jgi:Kdo2-lipid IVA lauroyltransferase/acyltransferase
MAYYFIITTIWFLSLWPLWLLYPFSDFVYFLVYHVFGYRKKVVFENLTKAFPEKSAKEINAIAKKFYRYHLCDLIIEVSKTRHISRKNLLKRISFKNIEIFDKYRDANKSIIAAIGHCGNWEWMAMYLSLTIDFDVYAIVKPFSDEKFDSYFDAKLRSRFTTSKLVPFKMALRSMIRNKAKLTMNIFATDQSPAKNEIEYWTTFLNHDTAVYLGTEKIAKALDMAVLFFDIQRKSRGYYEIEIIELCDNAKQTAEFEITEKHVKALEYCIRENPYNWLWSHRRWKHTR